VEVEYLSKATDGRMKVKLVRAPISVTPVTSAACKIGGKRVTGYVTSDDENNLVFRHCYY
jgi:hypothetical protein